MMEVKPFHKTFRTDSSSFLDSHGRELFNEGAEQELDHLGRLYEREVILGITTNYYPFLRTESVAQK
jgi:hypothetical protein